MADQVTTERVGGILVCTMNTGTSGNSITPELFAGLLAAWQEGDRDDAVRVIVTRSAGDHFCVGGDAGQLACWAGKPLEDCFAEEFEGRQGLASLGGGDVRALDPLGMNRWAAAVWEIGIPMVAQIRGAAAGGGLGIALLHHFRIADASAQFTTAFARLGLGTELGVAYLMQLAVGRQRSLSLALTSRSVHAEEALTIGLIDQLAPSAELDQEAMACAEQLARVPPLAARAMVEAHRAPYRTAFFEALRLEWRQQKILWDSEAFRRAAQSLGRNMQP
jgi:2-(1,2-epoxy-1,2-dihydrophenyl)acetyl-CoA isomerase